MSDRQLLPTLPKLRDVLWRTHLRLILLAVLLTGFVLVFSGLMIIRGYAARNLQLVAQTVSYTVEPAVVFGDLDAIHDGAAHVAVINDVRAIEVVDPDGLVLARWDAPNQGLIDRIEMSSASLVWPTPVKDTVLRHGKTIAEVRVYGGMAGFLQFLKSGALVVLACLGLTLLATQMLARRLRENVLDPLSLVTDVAREVRTNRTFGKRLPASGIFEIDQFGQDFNALLTELEGWGAYLELENEELTRKATHDGLTGLGNRALLERRLGAALRDAARTQRSFAMLYIDANKFKEINDTFGHEAGDVILKTIAARLMNTIRSNDAAFRQGGDEFAVILSAPVTQESVAQVIQRIDASMEQAIELPGGQTIVSSLSIGAALYPENGTSLADLIRKADTEMYADKQRKRNTGQEI